MSPLSRLVSAGSHFAGLKPQLGAPMPNRELFSDYQAWADGEILAHLCSNNNLDILTLVSPIDQNI